MMIIYDYIIIYIIIIYYIYVAPPVLVTLAFADARMTLLGFFRSW